MTTEWFERRPTASLRGTRDYFHSTDLYEQIASEAAALGLSFEGPIDIRIRAKIARQPKYLFAPEESDRSLPASFAAKGTFKNQGQSWVVVVTEAGELLTARRAYDEGPAARNSLIDGRRADLTGETGLRPIEAITALAVHLHKTALPPPPDKRWMLGQITLSRPLIADDTSHLSIEIDRVMGAMTRSRLNGKDGEFGTLLFILA